MIRTTSLGNGWQFASEQWLGPDGEPKKLGFSRLEWLPAQVPGHVHLDLVREGVIADPLHAHAELGSQWVDEARWTYRKTFSFAPDPSRPVRVLRFEGLDTVCRVLLNGQVIAECDNMFELFEVDVSDSLRKGENELSVEFESASRVGRERRAEFLQAEGLPDNVARLPERAFVRKAQYMFAWDWGPRLVSAGIWKPVSLVEFSSRLTDVLVEQKHRSDGSVELSVSSTVEGEGKAMHFVQGVTEPLVDGGSVVIVDPKLWWPSGMGEQPLYTVDSVLVPTGTPAGQERATALDARTTRIGLRRLRLLREKDTQGESFEFEINGKRLWAVGANWIPDHSMPASVDRNRLQAQIARAQDMNMNMLRVWGGGLYESDEFYDACDEAGMLVWQDFPFACCYVPDSEKEQETLRSEAAVNIRRLRNHASLALWCGNNENLTMWHSKWETPLPQPTRYYGEKLYDEVLPSVVEELDPARPYVASSPIGGTNANDGDIGDQHYWDVWHGRGDWTHYKDSTGRFASEFGFASAPSRSVWRKIFPSDHDWATREVRDSLARWHDKTGKGYDTYVGYSEIHYPIAANIGEFMYTSQLNQRDALRFGIEHYRRSVGCRGALIWQLNDCWPAQSWAVLDSDANYKAAAFELRRLYANALVSIEFEVGDKHARIWTLLDNAFEPQSDNLIVEARSSTTGDLVETWSIPLELENDERKVALEVDTSKFVAEETILAARWMGSETFRCLSEPKDATLSLPHLTVEPHADGIVVSAETPVVDLMLWDPANGAEFLDNFITLPAGGRMMLRVRGSWQRLCARSLAGVHTVQS